MKADLSTIKIEMSFDDAKELKEQMRGMINDINIQCTALAGYFDEAHLREAYPKVNELLKVLNVRDELPF